MNSSRIVNRSFIKEAFLYGLAIVLHPFLRVKKGRVVCFSYAGYQYSCNPKIISQYLSKNYGEEFSIYWLFVKGKSSQCDDENVEKVEYPSFRSMLIINTAEFVISNKRTWTKYFAWIKKKNQKYIMTWHGDVPLKRIEGDANLSEKYIENAKRDSAYADLFISGSSFMTNIYHKAFWYNGEILEKGTPRNDIFFNEEKMSNARILVRQFYNIEPDRRIVLYAPTFRDNGDTSCYNINWKALIPSLKQFLGADITLLIRMHPNLLQHMKENNETSNTKEIVNASFYPDMHELLVSSDVLITDYSSSMFEFSLLKRPCFIYATDSNSYTRGFYFNLSDLPFPVSESEKSFMENVSTFNEKNYLHRLSDFYKDSINSFEKGHATEEVVGWIMSHRIK